MIAKHTFSMCDCCLRQHQKEVNQYTCSRLVANLIIFFSTMRRSRRASGGHVEDTIWWESRGWGAEKWLQ
ncbi:hypothetical protein BHE74_00033258 [Ensete ventricosum]|uniref:Uncharacterized protein n=1 Tax=Ensete ventricosum TaxID=4639 RepID=A0A427AV21_ENSVE|nr:hypothetical protein B296_00014805 [Ensete ventricosum]RWW59786.1 hypothetical protein BHE74_00033258 [Ensete ventricosum]RZS26674.1 hypothetical protein BHM03_00060046 [Ensete ventricosum]